MPPRSVHFFPRINPLVLKQVAFTCHARMLPCPSIISSSISITRVEQDIIGLAAFGYSFNSMDQQANRLADAFSVCPPSILFYPCVPNPELSSPRFPVDVLQLRQKPDALHFALPANRHEASDFPIPTQPPNPICQGWIHGDGRGDAQDCGSEEKGDRRGRGREREWWQGYYQLAPFVLDDSLSIRFY